MPEEDKTQNRIQGIPQSQEEVNASVLEGMKTIVNAVQVSLTETNLQKKEVEKLKEDVSKGLKDIFDTKTITYLGLFILLFMMGAIVIDVLARVLAPTPPTPQQPPSIIIYEQGTFSTSTR